MKAIKKPATRKATKAVKAAPVKPLRFFELTLPSEFKTWKSYVKHLLKTVSKKDAATYISKFKVSLKFWRKKGGGLSDELIDALTKANYKVARNGKAIQGTKDRVIFRSYPDQTDNIRSSALPSWKRMVFCILSKDPYCTFMGFAMPKPKPTAAKKSK